MSTSRLSHGTSGWRRMVPVDEHGASSSTASNGCSGVHFSTSAQSSSASSDSRVEIIGEPLEPRRRAVDRRHLGAGSGKLRGLAAGRGAEIGNAKPFNVAEEPRRQRRRCVLHPPCAFGKTRQRRHRAVRDGAHRAGRQHPAAELFRPSRASLFTVTSSAGSRRVGGGNVVRGRCAVSFAPAQIEPFRRIEYRRIERGEPLLCLRARCAAAPR